MTEIRDRIFSAVIVDLDDKAFVDCQLQNCELRYLGGEMSFLNTSLTGCRWAFGGAAQRTLNVMECFDLPVNKVNFPLGRCV